MSSEELTREFHDFEKISNFVLQVRPESKVNINNVFNVPIMTFELSNKDLEMIKKYIIYFSNFLLECGFQEIILPFEKNYKFNSIKKIKDRINNVKKKSK